MSGRKSWEVASILEQSESIQDEIFGQYSNQVQENINRIIKKNSECNKMKVENENFIVNKGEFAKQEFNNDYDDLIIQIDKTKMVSVVNIEESGFIKEKDRLMNEIQNCRIKSRKLRERIRNNNHYCDQEYNEANSVKYRVENAKLAFNQLLFDTQKGVNRASQNVNILESRKQNCKDINTKIIELDKKAKTIKENREKANVLRDDLREDYNNIDKSIAIKFYPDKYVELNKHIDIATKMSEIEVIKKYKDINTEILRYKIMLEEKYAKWKEEKRNSEILIKSLKEKIDSKDFQEFEDELRKKDKKISLLDFLERYGKKYKEKMSQIISNIDQAFDDERFSDANIMVLEAQEFINNLNFEAINLREKVMSEIKLALKMRDIMKSVGFNVHINVINESYIDGFSLICKNGDTINFEKIEIVDGAPKIEIDHIEGTTGTCGMRWDKLKEKFNSEGIPLTDVLKNEKSVVYRDKRIEATESKNKIQKKN